jgi:hypothetical protein
MITGHNTDVEYAGRVYHVQTEDKGTANPVIETLVYSKGEILDTCRRSYLDISADAGEIEPEVLRRMEMQHQRCIREVRNGRYDPDGPKPFGWNIITNRGFEEVVLDTLRSGVSGELQLDFQEDVYFFEGASAIVDLVARLEGGDRPAGGAFVRIKLVRTSGRPIKLFEGKTNEEGRLRMDVGVPALNGGEAIVLIQVDSGGAVAEMRRPVLRHNGGS